jgi:hypothetical protein
MTFIYFIIAANHDCWLAMAERKTYR